MPPTCTICRHPQRAAIEKARAAGVPFRSVAKQYGTSASAVYRHEHECMAAAIAEHASAKALETVAVLRAHEAQEGAHADGLLAQVAAMKREAEAILQDARRSPGSQARRDALLAIDKALKALELIGRIEGELRDGAQVHLTLVESPEWRSLQAKLVAVLDPHPAARAVVLAALREDMAIPALPAHDNTSGGPVASSEKNGDLRIVREPRRVRGTH